MKRNSSLLGVLFSAVVSMITVSMWGPAVLGEELCLFEGESVVCDWQNTSGKASSSDPLNIKFVFVKFPNTGALAPEDTLFTAICDSLMLGFRNALFYQSNGRHVVNCSAIFVPGDSANTRLWTADFASGLYGSSQTTPENFLDCWYADVNCLGVTGPSMYESELPAEILGKIQNAYNQELGSGSWVSPLTGVDAVVFVYLPGEMPNGTSGSPVMWHAAGYGHAPVKMCGELEDVFGSDPPLETVSEYSPPRLSGIVGNWWGKADLGGTIAIFAHEWGHKLGLLHMPGADGETYQSGQCSFGSYAMMRAAVMGNQQMHREFSFWEKVRLGWLDEVVVEENMSRFTLEDVRSCNAVYRIPVRTEETMDVYPPIYYRTVEYFLVGYQTGAYPWYGAPDTGVFVWHIVEGESEYYSDYYIQDCLVGRAGEVLKSVSPKYIDLEIASGLFNDPSEHSGHWQNPDAVNGFDWLDNWPDAQTGIGRPGYNNFPGLSSDLFNYSENNEFSFRANHSNPSSNSLVYPPDHFQNLKFSRLSPEGIPTSIMFSILEEASNSVVVNLWLAPEEEVLSPRDGQIYSVGENIDISWSTNFTTNVLDGIINEVDILFIKFPGAPAELIASGVDATVGGYSWSPSSLHVTSDGSIKIVYHNVNDSTHVGEDESDGVFAVVSPPDATFSDVSSQTGLNYQGTPYSGITFDFDGDSQNDLFVSISDDESSLNEFSSISPGGVPVFLPNVGGFIDQSMGFRGTSYADYDNDGDQDLFLAHGSQSKLFRNDSGTFVDVTTSMGFGTLIDASTAASWGDYDRDGWLDLYVCRAATIQEPPEFPNIYQANDRLFRNEVGEGGGFLDVSTSTGIATYSNTGSVSVSWVDFDGDGDMDIFVPLNQDIPVGGPGGLNTRLYVNQNDDTFTEEYDLRFPGHLILLTGAKWGDFDNDGYFDVAYSFVHGGRPGVYLNDGTGNFPVGSHISFDAPTGHSGVQVLDQDLDGRQDLLFLSNDALRHSLLFTNLDIHGEMQFVETTSNAGLTDIGKVMGGVAADFTGDGDSDLYLGKPIADGKFFFRTETTAGADPLGKNYVKVLLSSPDGVNNRFGVGAVVTVTAGTLVQTQVVDGGSGRGGQDGLELTFGLGSYSGAVTASVRWPGGYTQNGESLTISTPSSETINTIFDDTSPQVQVSKVAASSVFNPTTGKMDWTFYWETDVSCDPSLDELTFDHGGISNPCFPGWTTVTRATPGVGHTYKPKHGGGYSHELKLYSIDCISRCSFRYYVTSGAGTNLDSCSPITQSVKSCPSVP